MIKINLKGPTSSFIDPRTFVPTGIGGSPLLDITPFEQKLTNEVTEWLNNTMRDKWLLLKNDNNRDYSIQFNNDKDATLFALRWTNG